VAAAAAAAAAAASGARIACKSSNTIPLPPTPHTHTRDYNRKKIAQKRFCRTPNATVQKLLGPTLKMLQKIGSNQRKNRDGLNGENRKNSNARLLCLSSFGAPHNNFKKCKPDRCAEQTLL